jgi:hypothetical protein
MNFKILALINAKKTKHKKSLEIGINSRENIETTIKKWKHIS